MKESGFFDTEHEKVPELDSDFKDMVLLKKGAVSSLYRTSRDGRYFILKTATDNKPVSTAIIKREYEIASGLSHPNIIFTYIFECTNEGDAIVMEYIDGRDLNAFLSENPSKKSRQKVFGQLLAAVGYLHGKNIIHNDLKPENILITYGDNNLKLIDFGLSDDDAHYLIKTLGYTDSFAAPELKEYRHSDVRSDIYSIGKLMNMLFGNRYRRISKKCTHTDINRRFQNINVLRRVWKNRNLGYKIGAGFILLACIVGLVVGYAHQQYVNERKTRELEQAMVKQKEERLRAAQQILIQKEELEKFQDRYTNLTDSIEKAEKSRADHQAAIAKRKELFMGELRGKIVNAEMVLSNINDNSERAIFNADFYKSIQDFYEKFDKNVDGENISPALYSIMVDMVTNFQKRTNTSVNLSE